MFVRGSQKLKWYGFSKKLQCSIRVFCEKGWTLETFNLAFRLMPTS